MAEQTKCTPQLSQQVKWWAIFLLYELDCLPEPLKQVLDHHIEAVHNRLND